MTPNQKSMTHKAVQTLVDCMLRDGLQVEFAVLHVQIGGIIHDFSTAKDATWAKGAQFCHNAIAKALEDARQKVKDIAARN